MGNRLAKQVSKAHATKIIAQMEPDDNGLVSFNQYVAMVLSDRECAVPLPVLAPVRAPFRRCALTARVMLRSG